MPLRRRGWGPTLRGMKKRITASVLWFLVTWYAWNVLAWMLGLPELAGPVIAAAVAAFIAGDPMHLIWSRTKATAEPTALTTAGAPQLS
jgi:hypothetical protein